MYIYTTDSYSCLTEKLSVIAGKAPRGCLLCAGHTHEKQVLPSRRYCLLNTFKSTSERVTWTLSFFQSCNICEITGLGDWLFLIHIEINIMVLTLCQATHQLSPSVNSHVILPVLRGHLLLPPSVQGEEGKPGDIEWRVQGFRVSGRVGLNPSCTTPESICLTATLPLFCNLYDKRSLPVCY